MNLFRIGLKSKSSRRNKEYWKKKINFEFLRKHKKYGSLLKIMYESEKSKFMFEIWSLQHLYSCFGNENDKPKKTFFLYGQNKNSPNLYSCSTAN